MFRVKQWVKRTILTRVTENRALIWKNCWKEYYTKRRNLQTVSNHLNAKKAFRLFQQKQLKVRNVPNVGVSPSEAKLKRNENDEYTKAMEKQAKKSKNANSARNNCNLQPSQLLYLDLIEWIWGKPMPTFKCPQCDYQRRQHKIVWR